MGGTMANTTEPQEKIKSGPDNESRPDQSTQTSPASDPVRSLAIGSPLAIVLQRKANRGDDDAAAKLAKLLHAATIAQDLPTTRKSNKRTKSKRLKKRKAAKRAAAVELVEDVVPDAPKIAVHTFEDIHYQIGNVEWLWEPYVPRGMVTMVAARAKGGKTRFVVGALIAPMLWPDRFAFPDQTTWTRPKGQLDKVMWIDTEAGSYTVDESLLDLGLPCNRVIAPSNPNMPQDALSGGKQPLTDKAWQEHLRKTIEQERPALVVVDSLTGAVNGDLNSNQTTQPVMQFLADVATQYKIAVVVIHHCNKPKPGKPEGEIGVYDITGHSSITNVPRSFLLIDKPNGNDPEHRRLRLGMSGFCDPSRQVEYGFRLSPSITWTDDVPQPEDQTPTTSESVASAAEWLTNELRNGPVLAKQIEFHAKANDITGDALKRAKKVIGAKSQKQSGVADGSWCWYLPEGE